MTAHIPILVKPIVDALVEPFSMLPESSEPHWLVDCTLGGGGHTRAFLEAFASDPRLRKHRVLSLDQDARAIEAARANFAPEISQGRLELAHGRFGIAREAIGDRPVLGLMADLGFSSDQLEDPSRGLSFQLEGPLDMRLDPSQGQSCREYLRTVSESELERVIRELGEERFARRIARAIVLARNEKKLPGTTRELADLIVKAVPPPARHGRIHAATRTFQALRIEVNDELGELDKLLKHVILCVRPQGRVAILSFHSLEDRMVKLVFKEKGGFFSPLTKKPLEADEDEIRRNPRSRSAKLRIAERVSG